MFLNALSKRLCNTSKVLLRKRVPVTRTLNYSTNYKIDLKINDVSLNKYIAHLQEEFNGLRGNRDAIKQNRLLELQPVINLLQERQHTVENIVNLKELLEEKDEEIRMLALQEKKLFEQIIQKIDEQMCSALLPNDESDKFDSIVLEVNAGVGGQEAMLFANELFDMYCNFAKYKGWEVEIAAFLTTEIGGIRHASALISGHLVFRFLKFEAGVHRVQRIPVTEKGGRTHTSTASVIALPQPTDIDIKLDSKDLRIETKRASGAGGQHVNTTDSAVRIVHLPTGLAVECQVDRSQIKNKKIALQKLRALLYQKQLDEQVATAENTRKSQVKSNFRNEKIRTYNFSQDRITDHRLQGCNLHNLKVFLEGGESLENLIKMLDNDHRLQLLLNNVRELEDKSRNKSSL